MCLFFSPFLFRLESNASFDWTIHVLAVPHPPPLINPFPPPYLKLLRSKDEKEIANDTKKKKKKREK